MLHLLVLSAPTLAQTRPVAESAGPWTQLAPTALEPSLPFPPELVAALSARNWTAAVPLLQAIDRKSLSGADVGDLAFVQAWALQRANRSADVGERH